MLYSKALQGRLCSSKNEGASCYHTNSIKPGTSKDLIHLQAFSWDSIIFLLK